MTTAGERLKTVRKRRDLTQRELADASGVSLSTLRRLEQGEQESSRMETWRKFAAALHVPTMTLVGQPDEEGAIPDTADRWDAVKKALNAPSGFREEEDEPPTPEGLTEALDALVPLYVGDRFSDLACVLPGLLRDVDALGPEGREVRVRLLQRVGWLMIQVREFGAAEDALHRSMDETRDRLQATETVNHLCWMLLRRGKLAEARELATKWADDAEPVRISRATPTELSLWGWMLLRVSAACVRDNRPGEAEHAMRLARAAGEAVGREYQIPQHLSGRTFGPLTVLLKTAENAQIIDRPDMVLRLGDKVQKITKAKSQRLRVRPTSNNWNRHLLDVADAHSKTGNYGMAVEKMQDILRRSPEWLPNQRFARDIVGRVIEERRTLTQDMRDLAISVRLPI
ncbi:XRE family transcriptional regulator [Streptomyces klenkii]|uniref:XRE family transcriptional regulator n=1 Tax=Streptomyces klenkii TaxID=1420899 RepID=A0A3B0AGT8_9ACTN|nr:helix-turn-helix transcriptional regulator [Streptomyces klenkii]RKN59673.1 XRE family transcriptional regulator [Streptomyces klenkii]